MRQWTVPVFAAFAFTAAALAQAPAQKPAGAPVAGPGIAPMASPAPQGMAQQPARKPPSPRGVASTQVLGKWTTQGENTRYTDGKWIEIDYGRPIKRGREPLFGAGAEYGKKFLDGSTVWRAGANATTKLTTEVALIMGDKKIAPGTYALFVDLKESGWTLIVSTQKMQEKYDPADKTAIWGSSGYDPKFDVVRVPMKLTKLQHSVDQFTIAFADMSDKGGLIAMAWDKEAAFAPFSIAP